MTFNQLLRKKLDHHHRFVNDNRFNCDQFIRNLKKNSFFWFIGIYLYPCFFCSRLELMIKDKNTLTRVYGQGSLLLFNFSVVVVNESKENIERIERKVFHWSIIIIIWLIVCLQSKKNKLQLQWHSINQSNKIHESMAISIHLFD